MVRRWLLMSVITSVLTAWASAQPLVTLKGTLKGYFLSPDGNLSVYELPFTFPDPPASADLPKCLFPLWAGYYLQGEFSSQKPIQSLWLLSGSGKLLWRRHYTKGVSEGNIPYQAGGWLSVKGQDGLSIRLLVRFDDGNETVIRPHFPVLFEKVLPLKVDWLDFVRIAEVAHLLKVKGEEIWKGFTLDGIPFLLEGDEGQWVLVNHPKPPKGFVEYKGPLPKVPFAMKVHVGQETKEKERMMEEIGGWVQKVNGFWTAALRYFPNWWVLEDSAPIGYTVTRELDASYRLETIVHEAFHVWWFQRVKEPKTEGRMKKAQAIAAEIVERECLAKALEAKELKEKQHWIKAFLVQRKRRRYLEGANQSEIIFERWQEVVEGVATFVTWRAMQSGQAEDYQPLPEIDADSSFFGYQANEGVTPKITREMAGLLDRPYALGLAQILFLSEWVEGWQEKVMKGESLEELLNRVVSSVPVSPNTLAELEKSAELQFKEALGRTRGRLTEAKPPEPSVTIWLSLPIELVRLMKQMKETLGNPLIGINLPLPDFFIRVSPPVWILTDLAKSRVGILWDANRQLMVLYHPDGTVTLQGKGLEVKGKSQVSWDINGVHVRPDEKQKKTKVGASPMLRKKAWYAVVLPVALLAAIASRDMKALQEQETIAMEGTITGVFLNAATNQFEMVTLPVPSIEEDYYYCDEEEYILQATFTPSWDPSNPTTQDFIIYVGVTYHFDDPRRMVWNFQIFGVPIVTIGGRRYRPAIVERPCPCVGGTERRVCLQLIDLATGQVVVCWPIKKIPPPGQLLVKVFLIMENESDPLRPTIQPFPDVLVEAYQYSRKKKRWELKAGVTSDANGEALFPELAPGTYQLRGFKGRPIPACPRVTYEVTVVKNQRNITSIYFYAHKGIRGRVMGLINGDRVPLENAKVSLWRGDTKVYDDRPTDSNGYFTFSAIEVDVALNQYGNGTYTIKVIPPPRTRMRIDPPEATRNVDLTKCERTRPGDTCPRALLIDVGAIVFTYSPPQGPGPGGPGPGGG